MDVLAGRKTGGKIEGEILINVSAESALRSYTLLLNGSNAPVHCSVATFIKLADRMVQGHPKEQATFARISGYVEQTDIHSPAV